MRGLNSGAPSQMLELKKTFGGQVKCLHRHYANYVIVSAMTCEPLCVRGTAGGGGANANVFVPVNVCWKKKTHIVCFYQC